MGSNHSMGRFKVAIKQKKLTSTSSKPPSSASKAASPPHPVSVSTGPSASSVKKTKKRSNKAAKKLSPPKNQPSTKNKDIGLDVKKKYIELLSALPEESFQRNSVLQENSPFWNTLEDHKPEEDEVDESKHLTLSEQYWSRYVVHACNIYIECGLSDEQILNILNQTITYVAVCALRAGHRRVYFEDVTKVFFDPCEYGMPHTARQKYEALLGRLRAAIVGKKDGTTAMFSSFASPATGRLFSSPSTTPAKLRVPPTPHPSLNLVSSPSIEEEHGTERENQDEKQEVNEKRKRGKKKNKGNKERERENAQVIPVKRKLFDEQVMSKAKKMKLSKNW